MLNHFMMIDKKKKTRHFCDKAYTYLRSLNSPKDGVKC